MVIKTMMMYLIVGISVIATYIILQAFLSNEKNVKLVSNDSNMQGNTGNSNGQDKFSKFKSGKMTRNNFCSSCGISLDYDSVFCDSCGIKVKQT